MSHSLSWRVGHSDMEALPSIRGYPSAVKDLIGGVGDIYIVEV